MTEIHALPQPLTGQELVNIQQDQNGNIVPCSMSVAALGTFLFPSMDAWLNSLQTTLPTSAGVAWNNGGMLSIS